MRLTIKDTGGYVICVGADAWQNLQGVAAYATRVANGVVALFIQDGVPAAAATAAIIQRVASRRWPRLKMIVPRDIPPKSVDALTRRLADWRVFRPEITHWLVDVAQATPPTYDSAYALARNDDTLGLVKGERDGSWWLSCVNEQNVFATTTIEPPATEELDQGPLTDLLEPFCETFATIKWRESRAPFVLEAETLAQMVGLGGTHNWNWRTMVETASGLSCGQYEYDLRDFLATTLHALGVANVRLNVCLAWSELKEEPLIMDVVACHKGQLYVFDCRATTQGEGLSQAAFALVRQYFASLNVTGVVMRPDRRATAAERTLALLTRRAHIFDAGNSRQLFSQLGKLFDLPVPAPLRGIEKTALRFGGHKLPVMSAANEAQRIGAAMTIDDRIYDIWRGAHVADGSTDWPWRAARVTPDRWFLQGRVMQGGVADELRRRLEARFKNEKIGAEVRFFEFAPNRRFWHAVVVVPGDQGAFTRWLRKWERVPLMV